MTIETPRTIISRNTSPDIPFDRSVNAYRGCEHGCIYCFARPTHAYLGLSPGLDFESQLVAKPVRRALLRAELSKRGYDARLLAMGTNTDPYQPIEATHRITRACLEVLRDFRHPVSITTKSDRVVADLDILARLAADGLVAVVISVTTLDRTVARTLEPRAAAPRGGWRRSARSTPPASRQWVSVSPIVPAITDHEIETILAAAAGAGAIGAFARPVRLPHEVAPLFRGWLDAHYPDRAAHVMSLIRDARRARQRPRLRHADEGHRPLRRPAPPPRRAGEGTARARRGRARHCGPICSGCRPARSLACSDHQPGPRGHAQPGQSLDPSAPVPRGVAILLRGEFLSIGDVLRLHGGGVALIGLLVADIQAVAALRIGIDIVDDAVVLAHQHLVRRQASEHRLPLRGIGNADAETGGGKVALGGATRRHGGGRDRRGGDGKSVGKEERWKGYERRKDDSAPEM